MKKILSILLLFSLFAKAQTLPLNRIQAAPGSGYIPISTSTTGILSYSPSTSLPFIPTSSVSAFIPYVGANSFTTTNAITANTITVNRSLKFTASDYSNTAVSDIFKSQTTSDGVTIRSDNATFGLTIRNGTKKLSFYVDSTVSNPNTQIAAFGGQGLSIQSQGNVQLILGTNGNIGIGTTWTPTAVFQMKAGTAQYPAIALTSQTSYTGALNGVIWSDATYDFNFKGKAKFTNTVNVFGNMTLNSNSTATTTMPTSSGTVANLSDVVFSYDFSSSASANLSDAATLYIGQIPGFQFSGSSSNAPVLLPYNCTLIGYSYSSIVLGTLASSENSTLSINGSTTQYTLSTAITYSNPAVFQTYTVSGLSQNFNAGELINIKQVTPTWLTNPTNLLFSIKLLFVRRQ